MNVNLNTLSSVQPLDL